MTERHYTVTEIMGMRDSIKTLCLPWSGTNVLELEHRVEMQLRTYMSAGTDPAELSEKAMARIEGEMRFRDQTLARVGGWKGA